MKQRKRKAERGFQMIYLIGIMLLFLMFSAFAIDAGYYFAAQNRLQTAADAAALAGTQELYLSDAGTSEDRESEVIDAAATLAAVNLPFDTIESDDVALGFIDPDDKIYREDAYDSPTADPDYNLTNGYNAVRVAVRKTEGSQNGPLDTITAGLFGVEKMQTAALSVALLDRDVVSVTNGGVRPIYACQTQFEKAREDGNLSNNVVTVYGDHLEVDGLKDFTNCPAPGSGNWGFADLRDCDPGAPGASTTSDWFSTGYTGTVQTGTCRSTQPGNFISNTGVEDALDKLIQDKTVILIPLYDGYSGGGSNTNVDISAFAGFVITGYVNTGNASNRHITGYFTKAICSGRCETGDPGSSTSGGSVVKLRLAARS